MPIFKYVRGPGNLPGHYEREGDERDYQRIVAGFVVPSERPGAVIVVAEEMALRPPANIYFIAEAQES